jgi:LuxR family transcriptional regulator, activator of conjugal transfer of Ti plasmids
MNVQIQSRDLTSSTRSQPFKPFAGLGRCGGAPVRADASPAAKMLQARLGDLTAQVGLSGGVYVHLGHTICARRAGAPLSATRFLAVAALDKALYLDEGALEFDPAVHQVATAHTPYAWSMSAYDGLDEGQDWLASRLQRRGVHAGVVVPVQDYAAGPAYIAMHSRFSEEAREIVAKYGAELAFQAAAFHQDAKAGLHPFRHTSARTTLTEREINCLRLAALGQTATETAQILQVTTRTVEFHLKNAAEKFGASNKLRAVAVAISAGLITI